MTAQASPGGPDLTDRLRELNPVAEAPLDAHERADADVLLRRILAEPQPIPRRWGRRPAGWRRLVAATAVVVSLALAALVAVELADRGGRPAIADRAYAAVTDSNVIYHFVLDTTTAAGALSAVSRRELEFMNGRLESWYRADGSAFHSRQFRRDRDGRLRLYYESARTRGRGVDYDAERAVLGRYRRGEAGGRSAPGGSLDAFREAYREGEVLERGTTTFHGRPAYRLVVRRAQRGSFRRRIAFYVDRKTYLPLGTRERTRLEIDGRVASVRSESVYRMYERLPDTAANRKLLRMVPRPAARRSDQPAVLAP